ncbi:MAG: hypothetical protein AAB853_00055 [Patescibacteria group bacterium]
MKKLNFLLGALGGLFGGLLISNRKLRQDLRDAKDPSSAAKMLGKELHRGGREVAKEAKQWLESDDTQRNLRKAKRYMWHKWSNVKKEAESLGEDAMDAAKKTAANAYEKAKDKVERKIW